MFGLAEDTVVETERAIHLHASGPGRGARPTHQVPVRRAQQALLCRLSPHQML